nr:AlNc14C48G3854 [Albugo laibachii Nc14]CCA18411.1 AlNc14C50G3936 [Albugo laibachii Nc14]|eukprot:CCA18411.1 AlNc14C50G3936 [Albugo laibachii Nc14]
MASEGLLRGYRLERSIPAGGFRSSSILDCVVLAQAFGNGDIFYFKVTHEYWLHTPWTIFRAAESSGFS